MWKKVFVVRHLQLIALLFVLGLPIIAQAAKQDTLFMKDRTMRLGTITSRDSQFTHIKTDYENLVISNDDITRIGYHAAEDLLLPDIGLQLSVGMAIPSQFNFSTDVGARACVRYMVTRSFGLYGSLSYLTWQMDFDTTKPGNNIKAYNPPITETYAITALSPRIGAFIVAPLSKSSQALLGFDIGQTYTSISDLDSSVGPTPAFSYSLRLDLRFGIGDNLALLVGAQYESFSTDYAYLEQHSFMTGPTRRIGDILLSVGLEYGF